MNRVYLIAARRTPILRVGKQFAALGPERLAAPVINELLTDSGIAPAAVDHVMLGNAAGPGGNVARVSTLASKLPETTPATTLDAQCASGLDAIAGAARMIAAGEAEAVIAGGVESASTAPWRVSRPRDPFEPVRQYSRARFTPSPDPDPNMGVAAENIARRFGISRERQDAFALQSQQRAVAAQRTGHFSDELVPLTVNGSLVQQDSCPRPQLTAEKLAALRPAFVPGGTVTAGNCCPINDAAAAVLLVSEARLHELRPEFALRYLGTGHGACDPQVLGMAAVPAYRQLLARVGEPLTTAGALIEFNEAFAVQALACLDELGIDSRSVNLDGGAIALGHPYGASGAILVTRLFWQARRSRRSHRAAVALMAAAGGTGTAVGFQSVDLRYSAD